MTNKNIFKLATMLLLLPAFLQRAAAQTSTQPAQYFFNQYLGNAAMAGAEDGLHVFAGYHRQMDNIAGAPTNILFTADYNAGKRVGLGLNVTNIKAGVLQHTKALLTYAYHLPVGTNHQRVSFGISGGFIHQRIDQEKLVGSAGDPTLQGYNDTGLKMDGDVGIAYTDDHFNFQVAVPSLRERVDKDQKEFISKTTFFASAAYKFELTETVNSIIPKVAFSEIKGYENVLDLGASVQFLQDMANVQALYHSTKNFTVGAGFKIMSQYELQLFYTSQPSEIKAYTSPMLSVNIKANLFSK
ncbi:PorP/SprF family type IX secretion system membrane protein [Chitinophaga sp. sic0106]|uniref:PorP/SprF family type IX secretion system membrane protein n=1 Tax=Chitinophaga sp. sic0106 TaxID=2854785 RepID=UPI001C471670|nr:PorP/SprF family type IX secretion system membrane protein [Chitinophaga sp. sic0106]MBV7532463.1 PorP/SprF family type IX secretion system membrane protein [Chitinophaga sp. sic0106]